eukprot:1792975-Alexandrium_andersonii.AAC.1
MGSVLRDPQDALLHGLSDEAFADRSAWDLLVHLTKDEWAHAVADKSIRKGALRDYVPGATK